MSDVQALALNLYKVKVNNELDELSSNRKYFDLSANTLQKERSTNCVEFVNCLNRQNQSYSKSYQRQDNCSTKEVFASKNSCNVSLDNKVVPSPLTNLEQVPKALIEQLDNRPIVMPNQLENEFALTKSLINNMIDTLTANRQQSLSSTLMLLKEVTLLLNSYNTSSLDLSILASQMNTNSLSVNSQNFIAFYIIGINLSFYIKTIDKKYFTEYKKEKEKEKEPKRTKDKIKDQKQRMQEFSAQFDFGIA